MPSRRCRVDGLLKDAATRFMNGAKGAQTFLSFPSGSKTAARSVTSFSSNTLASILRIFLSESFWEEEPPLLEEPFFIEPPWTMVAIWFGFALGLKRARIYYRCALDMPLLDYI